MRKLVLLMHTSLDGFVAGPAGEMDWISVDEEIFHYASQQTKLADTALYGRITWQMMDAYWPNAADQPNPSRHDVEHSHWYNTVTKIVVSKTLPQDPAPGVTVIQDDIENAIRRLKSQAGKNILMIGSPSTAHALMHENLIDNYWIFVNPILLGKGIPLFSDIKGRINLNLVHTKLCNSGVAAIHYERVET